MAVCADSSKELALYTCVYRFALVCLTSGFRFIIATLVNSKSVNWTAVCLL